MLLLKFTNNKGTIITAVFKGVVIYAEYQTHIRFEELQ